MDEFFTELEGGSGSNSPARPPERKSQLDLKTARTKIVSDIFENGLIPSAVLEQSENEYLMSTDDRANKGIYGRVFKPRSEFRDKAHFMIGIHFLLYLSYNSIMAVVPERSGEGINDAHLHRFRQRNKARRQDKEKFEDRLSSSMLVVYQAKEGEGGEAAGITRDQDETKAKDIICVLIPKEIMDDIEPETIEKAGIDVRVVSKKIKRSLYHGDKLKMPDYEGEIIKLLEEENESFWIHGVRLPTQEDIDKRRI